MVLLLNTLKSINVRHSFGKKKVSSLLPLEKKIFLKAVCWHCLLGSLKYLKAARFVFNQDCTNPQRL